MSFHHCVIYNIRELEPDTSLPNQPDYRMCPNEHEELRSKVKDLISKGHVKES